jgi:hypothetical protein
MDCVPLGAVMEREERPSDWGRDPTLPTNLRLPFLQRMGPSLAALPPVSSAIISSPSGAQTLGDYLGQLLIRIMVPQDNGWSAVHQSLNIVRKRPALCKIFSFQFFLWKQSIPPEVAPHHGHHSPQLEQSPRLISSIRYL